MRERVFLNDTAIIDVNLTGEDGVSPMPASSVSWKIKKPGGSVVDGGPVDVENTNVAVPFYQTDEAGAYHAQVTFLMEDNVRRSSILNFEVVDPLETTGEATNDVDRVVDRAWMKLEDLFDSQLGGPHVRDRTLQHFDREKLKRLLPDAFYGINNFYQPATSYNEESFNFEGHGPLLAQALLVESIMHLIRSYVEQPNPLGGNPSYFDRRDYLQRWQSVLDAERTKLEQWLDLFKRGQMGFDSSLLVSGYSGYSQRYPRYARGRYPYVFRW
jgi:hypothetical protein